MNELGFRFYSIGKVVIPRELKQNPCYYPLDKYYKIFGEIPLVKFEPKNNYK